MSSNIELDNSNNNIFGVKHYKVKVLKKEENIFHFIVNVMSYALFIFLLLIGGTLLIYIADIKLRAMKGDYSAPVFNAYVVLSGSMLPEIKVKDAVVTKKIEEDRLKVGDIVTYIPPDPRYGGISITHRIIDKKYNEKTQKYSYQTKGDNNNVSDPFTIENSNILGKVILKIPKLGYLQEILASKGGLIILVLIPCLTILSYDIMKLFKKITPKKVAN